MTDLVLKSQRQGCEISNGERFRPLLKPQFTQTSNEL